VEAFGVDVVRYYLMREVGFGQDGDFAHKHVLARYNGELANGLGNLLNRMIASIVRKHLDATVPEPGEPTGAERDLLVLAERVALEAAEHLDAVQPHRALEKIWELVGATNRYVDQTAPWALAKNGEKEALGRVSYTVLEALRWLSVMIAPFMPTKAAGLRKQLGLEEVALEEGTDNWPRTWGELKAGTKTDPGDPLFPRIHPKEQAKLFASFGLGPEGDPVDESGHAEPTEKAPKKKSKTKEQTKVELPEGCIAFDDFLKVELKVGLVGAAEAVEGSDKLLRLEIDLGEGKPRQVLAGIRKHYAAEDLKGKRVIVVANLAPRKIFGLESQGMVLAASTAEAFSVLTVEAAIPPGTRVS
jgi:methionyl-tRNA synthetase